MRLAGGFWGVCACLFAVAVVSYAPPPPEDDDHTPLKGGARQRKLATTIPASEAGSGTRTLFMDLPGSDDQQQEQPPQAARGGQRWLFMEMPEGSQEGEAQQQSAAQGGKRSLFMDMPEEEEQQQQQQQQQRKEGGRRGLFMDMPDEDSHDQQQQQQQQYYQPPAAGKRNLAIDPSGGAQEVIMKPVQPGMTARANQLLKPTQVKQLPLFAFPGLKARTFQSEGLLSQGHNSLLSRLIMLAEMGEAFDKEKGLETEGWGGHASMRKYGQDDAPKRW